MIIIITSKKNFEFFLLIFALIFTLFVDDITIRLSLHILVYIFVAIVISFSLFKSYSRFSEKMTITITLSLLLILQVFFVLLSDWTIINRIMSILLLILTFSFEAHILNRKKPAYFTTAVSETCLSFEDARKFSRKIRSAVSRMKVAGTVMSPSMMTEILKDIPRNSAYKYINKETLSDEYLKDLDESLDDENIYIVMSDTGSPASDFIGVFTNKPFNHVSIAFDRDLKTLISYNGGEKVYPPGLNSELIEYFCKKSEAKIYVYSLPVTKEQKKIMTDKIKQINIEGSAYNLIGLALKKAYRPNMMFCSQFVYSMLVLAGVNYFEKKASEIKPTDLVELDYERKLNFLEVITLSNPEEIPQKPKKSGKIRMAFVMAIIFCVAIASITSNAYFKVANPFATVTGLYQIMVTDLNYKVIQEKPTVILSKPDFTIEDYMKSKGFFEDLDERTGLLRVFKNNSDETEYVECIEEGTYSKWIWYE